MQPAGEAPAGVSETTVLIVDDHQCFADLLAGALDTIEGIRCVGTVSSAEAAVDRVLEVRPSVVVMDIQMPGTDGLAATRSVRLASPETAVAVVTAHQDAQWVARAARAGASVFIPKGGPLAELISLLRAARPGTMRVAPSAMAAVDDTEVLDHHLTAREREVLVYIGQGLEAKSIAKVMGISVHTCRGYIKSVYATLRVSSRIAAVNRARELGLLAS